MPPVPLGPWNASLQILGDDRILHEVLKRLKKVGQNIRFQISAPSSSSLVGQ